MLIARGHTHIGQGDLRWAVVFAGKLWSILVDRDGLVHDTRFVPPAADTKRPTVCLYLLLSGSFSVHGGRCFESPAAFVLSDEQLEGAQGRRPLTFSAKGHPFSSIQVYLAGSDLSVTPGAAPVEVALDERTWEAARAAARLSEHDDDALQRAFTAFIEATAKSGVLGPNVAVRALDPPSNAFSLLWRALRPMIERFYLSPTLQEVGDATGVSTRQVERYVQQFVAWFALVGEGWRPSTRHLRLKLAVILLSAEGASVADVAGAVGYMSSDAMGRAFRDAGLPPPTVVQEEVRAIR
jgi:AraC-like DNA-binding protein